jgi:histidine ammonia-lyase
MQEDHVSMGWGAALKLRRLLENLTHILAVELVCAAEALDLRAPLHPAAATAAVRELVRTRVPAGGADRPVSPDLEAAADLVRSGAVVERAAQAAGDLA